MSIPHRAVASAALAIALLAPPCFAQDAGPADEAAAQAPPVIPDTPAGDAARQFIDMFNDGTLPTIREPDFVGPLAPGDPTPGDLRFTPQAEQRVPAARIAEYMDQRRPSFVRFSLYGVTAAGEDHVGVLVQGEGDGLGWLLEVWTEPEWPHRIAQWQFIPNAEATRLPEINSWGDLEAAFDRYARDGSLTYAFAVMEQPANVAGPGGAQTLTRLGSDERLNIGAMMRYFVFDALVAQINEGARAWDGPMTIPLTAHSLPPARASQAPPDLEVLVKQVVQEAMLAGDNTALDALIEVVGRDAVLASLETRTGQEARNTPLLDTMDLFKLKIGAQGSVIEDFMAADEATQLEMLDNEVAANTVPEQYYATWRKPQHVSSVGWFATAEDLAGLLADLWSVEGDDVVTGALFAQAPVPAQGEEWEAGAFRAALGDRGVVGAYWLLRRDDGRRFIVTLVINDEDALVAFEPLQPILFAAVQYLGRLDRDPGEAGGADDGGDGAGAE